VERSRVTFDARGSRRRVSNDTVSSVLNRAAMAPPPVAECENSYAVRLSTGELALGSQELLTSPFSDSQNAYPVSLHRVTTSAQGRCPT